MKIAAYNVNGINGRLQMLLRWLMLAEPDVVCLQELKAPDSGFPASALRDLGYDAVWHAQPRWNGLLYCRALVTFTRLGAVFQAIPPMTRADILRLPSTAC